MFSSLVRVGRVTEGDGVVEDIGDILGDRRGWGYFGGVDGSGVGDVDGLGDGLLAGGDHGVYKVEYYNRLTILCFITGELVTSLKNNLMKYLVILAIVVLA